jgi:hypothetical protein
MTPGGKAGGSPAARLLLQAGEPEEAEPLAPFTDDPARGIEAARDDVIVEPFRSQEDDFGPDDITIR